MKQMTYRRIASILGFIALGVVTFTVYGVKFVETISYSPILVVIVVIWIIGLLFETIREWNSAYSADSEEQRYDFPTDTLSFVSVLLGAVVTYWISVDLGQGAVVASGLVGIFGAAFVKLFAVPLYCGSFVGMASASLLLMYPGVVLAGAIAGVVFVLAKHVFNGFGGKLGTIAFASSVLAALIVQRPFLGSAVPDWGEVGWLMVTYCTAAAVVTFILSVWFGNGPVLSSGMVGLAGGLLLPAIHGSEIGGLIAIGVFSASFAGMSGTNRFEKFYWMIPAGVLCALGVMYTSPYMGGAGGKLGTIAFGAVVGVRGLMVIGIYLLSFFGVRTDDDTIPNS